MKIREKEIRVPPHVTILKGTQAWRINLRTGDFMDAEPDPAEVPKGLVEHATSETVWKQLCDEWDKKYPQNLVSGAKDTDDEQNDHTNN